MNYIDTNIDLHMPEYIDRFREYQPDLERVMVKLESRADPDLMNQALGAINGLRHHLTRSSDTAIITVGESLKDLSDLLTLMLESGNYVRSFSDLVLLTLDRLESLIHEAEEEHACDFAMAQAIHVILQTLKNNATLASLESDIEQALEKLVNVQALPESGSDDSCAIELFGEGVPTPEPIAGQEKEKEAYGLFMESMDFLNRVETLELEPLLLDNTYIPSHATFIIPMALTLNKMLNTDVSDDTLYQAFVYHDIGERSLPGSIFSDKKLSDLEFALIKTHPLVSASLIKPFVGEEILQIVEQHHERVNGNGYPNHLRGDEICIGAKILSLCDAFYAMTQPRAHKPVKRSYLRALAEINACSGSQFDSQVVEAFNELMQCEKIRAYAPGSRGVIAH